MRMQIVKKNMRIFAFANANANIRTITSADIRAGMRIALTISR